MTLVKRPVSVTIVACVYIVVGIIGGVVHVADFRAGVVSRFGAAGIELVQLLALVAGVFMVRGLNWARWLAAAWMAFHVIVSAFHDFREFAIHLLLCALIVWVLFRPAAARYFQR